MNSLACSLDVVFFWSDTITFAYNKKQQHRASNFLYDFDKCLSNFTIFFSLTDFFLKRLQKLISECLKAMSFSQKIACMLCATCYYVYMPKGSRICECIYVKKTSTVRI